LLSHSPLLANAKTIVDSIKAEVMVGSSEASIPERLEVRDEGLTLRIVWPNQHADELGAGLLRRECRSAGARRRRIDGVDVEADDVRITAVEPVGNYAVNIAFSDGEERGIYPFIFLAELAMAHRTADTSEPAISRAQG